MKKIASLILALSLCLALAVPAFAQTDVVKTDYGTYTFDFGNATLSDISLPIARFDPTTSKTNSVATTFKSVDLKAGDSFQFTNDSDAGRAVAFAVFGKSAEDKGCYIIATLYGVDVAAGEQATIKVPTMKEICDTCFKYTTYKALAEYACLQISVSITGFEDSDAYYIPLSTADFNAANPNAPAQTTPPDTTVDKPADTSAPATTAPATTTPATTALVGSDSYTAQKYDNYGKLAVNNYGTYAVTKALQKANNYKTLKAGVAVTLPDTLGKVARIAPAVAGEGEKLYTVLAGDTLGTIAKAYFGNSTQYKAIFERNADRLKNANTIYEGQIIVLPAK